MATIKSSPKTNEYESLRSTAKSMGENNDCSVKAVALVCGVPYEQAHAVLKELGRKPGKGATLPTIMRAVRALGKQTSIVGRREFISKYPAGHRDVLKNITTHHPARFHDVWKDGKTYLAFTRGHVLAIIDGVNHDHTVGSAKRIKTLHWVY